MKKNDELEMTAAAETAEKETVEEELTEVTEEVQNAEPAEPAAESESAGEPDGAEDGSLTEEPETDAESQKQEKKKKKPFFLQVPVIISLVLVLLTVVGYFVGKAVYNAYFLHLPQGIIWEETNDGITRYYEFDDETKLFTMTYASIEESVTYDDVAYGDDDYILLYYPEGTVELKYTITGARCKKDQELTFTNSSDVDIIKCKETDSKTVALELPTEVKVDDKLLGEWKYEYSPEISVYLWVNADGSMRRETTYHFDSIDTEGQTKACTYIFAVNYTYTISDGNINYTIAEIEEDEETGKQKIKYEVANEPYDLKGDQLVFLKMPFVRVNASTPDEATPNEA